MKRVNLISLFGQSVDVGLRFGGNVCITVGLCALEVPLKQQRCWGGGWTCQFSGVAVM